MEVHIIDFLGKSSEKNWKGTDFAGDSNKGVGFWQSLFLLLEEEREQKF